MILSLDTETTGLDLHHGAKPFIVTFANEEGENIFFEWDVDPLTREPQVDENDIEEIQGLIDEAELLILQHSKFDVVALQTIFEGNLRWDWSKVHDTIIMAHLIESNKPKDLTYLVLRHLRINVKPYEDRIEAATKVVRAIVKRDYPDWKIAHADLDDMPSAKGKVWKHDMWLPRALDKKLGQETEAGSLCVEYANCDSAITLQLYIELRNRLIKDDLWGIFLERMKAVPVIYGMERVGVTLNGNRLNRLVSNYKEESEYNASICRGIANSLGTELELPKSGNNKSLLNFVFNDLKLPPVKVSKKTGAPSLDKVAVDQYLTNLPHRSKQRAFVRNLSSKRKRDTAINYMESYKKFWKRTTKFPAIAVQSSRIG